MDRNSHTSGLKTNIETRILEVIDNTGEVAIKINESKARLIYNNYMKAKRGDTVFALFCLFLSCITTLSTTSFNDVFGIEDSATILKSAFSILTLASLLATCWWYQKWRDSLKRFNENEFINELKGTSRDK